MQTDAHIEDLLQFGKLTPLGRFTYGSNYTFLVSVEHEGKTINAVYKPQQGERPLWDFPDGTLSQRERAAYLLSNALRLDLVPPTILRPDAPFGPGSLQLFIEHDPNRHYFNLDPDQREGLLPLAFFDLLANNADRKGSHLIFRQADNHLFAIDHGLCFNAEPKLRTVIWNFAGKPIPRKLLKRLAPLTDFNAPLYQNGASGLADLLSPPELVALQERAASVLAQASFPFPPEDKRAYPYPPL